MIWHVLFAITVVLSLLTGVLLVVGTAVLIAETGWWAALPFTILLMAVAAESIRDTRKVVP